MENRKIKFKVWDNWNKKFLDYGEVDIWDLVFTEPKLMEEIYTDGMANEWLEFLQDTGITDKNGVEIYNGDIVRDGDDIFEIKFQEGRFVGVMDENIILDLSEFAEDCEVIGNIYENKELLYKII